MDNREFVQVRRALKKTQKKMAPLLGVSLKAVQSFEQGWRDVPAHVERQMLMLYSLRSTARKTIRPCWEITTCPDEHRKNCIVWEHQVPHYCWLVNGTYCQGKFQNKWEDKIKLCRQCEVLKSMLNPYLSDSGNKFGA